MFISYRIKIIVLFIWPILLGLSLFHFFGATELELRNDVFLNSKFYLQTHNDSADGGKSISLVDTSTNIFQFSYTLSDSILYPYSTFEFVPRIDSLIDLSGYDEIEIKVKAKYGLRVPIILLTGLEGYSSKNKRNSYLHNRQFMQTSNQWTVIHIPMEEMEIPSWWYFVNHLTERDPLKRDFSKVKSIEIGSCGNLLTGLKDEIEIEYIRFGKDKSRYYAFWAILLLGFFASIVSIFKTPKESKVLETTEEKLKNIHEEEIFEEIESTLTEEETLVLDYIQTHYRNPDMSLSDLQEILGINERKITAIVKDFTSLSFKQYLNGLRIEEARNLLLKTDLNVSEIAYQIGYGNVSHFNRVFKSFENISPTDFRANQIINQ